jgi:hypothetical protein
MPDRPFLIFQMNSQIRELSRSWIKGALSVIAQQIKSADLTNDQRRRFWAVFDECPQYASQDDDILEFFTTGRKKGVCPIIICQAPSQFEKSWGKPKYKTLETTVGIKLCGRLGAGEDAKEVASVVIGDSYWIQRKGNRNLGKDGGGNLSFEHFHEPLVLPNWFEQALGPAPDGKGVRIAWIGPSHVARLLIPFSPNWHRGDARRTPHREGVVLAEWVKRPRQAVIAHPTGGDQQGRRPRREATAEERARARQGSSQEDASHPGKPLGL